MNQAEKELFTLSNILDQPSSVFFNTCFDKSHVKELVSWFLNKHGEKQTINFLESLKYTGFHQATQAGISLGIEDLEIPPEKPNLITEAQITTHKIEQKSASGSLTSVEKSQYLIDTWNQTSDLLRQNAIQNFRNRNVVNPVYMMAFSGARGNISQVRQLVAMRGLMADPQGAILEFPIQSNFREGLTITEYLISCYGARKGLVDTALRTATSGYLTRRLVDSAQHAVISVIDCGTPRGILLEGKHLETRLLGRVLAQPLISQSHSPLLRNQLISEKVGKIICKNYNQVLIRSPLTCDATTSVCQCCYGWNLASGKLVQIGDAVGVIAAQSIGEPGTQLTMRTFHTGGVGVFSDQALKPVVSPYEGNVIFHEPIPGHFVRTPHGKIVYMVKYVPNNPNRILFQIKTTEIIQRDFIVREQDLPPGSLLFVKHGENVISRQLLAQSSNLKLTKQQLPESSHPVYSSLAGQVFFEAMNLAIEKEVISDGLQKTSDIVKNSGLPDVRRMAKIGSFWVFSAYNQHEIHTNECFIESGDLVSKNTILYNYKFYSPNQQQVYRINLKLAFGFNILQIPIKKVNFNKLFYKITIGKSEAETAIYKRINNHTYPNSISSDLVVGSKKNKFCYTHICSIYLQSSLNLISEKESNQFRSQPLKGSIFQIKNPSNFSPNKINKKERNLIKKIFPEFIKNRTKRQISSHFVNTCLKTLPRTIEVNSKQCENNFLTNFKKMGWVYIPNPRTFSSTNSLTDNQFFPTGSCLDNISFPKCNVSLKFLTPIAQLKSFSLPNFKNTKCRSWYDSQQLINQVVSNNFENFSNKIKVPLLPSNLKTLSNAKNRFGPGLIWYKFEQKSFQYLKNKELFVTPKKLILFQSLQEYRLPPKNNIQKKWASFTTKIFTSSNNQLVIAKQNLTVFELRQKYEIKLKTYNLGHSGFVSLKNLIRIEFLFTQNLEYPNLYFQYQTLSNSLSRGLTIFQYYFGTFKNPTKFHFQTYVNNWIIPSQAFSSGIVKLQTSGEFRYKKNKTTGTFISILRKIDCLTMNVGLSQFSASDSNRMQIGDIIRWGDEIYPNFGCEHNGQILNKNNSGITIRLGIPILASARGIVHVFQNDLVDKNQLLITLKSRRLQTEDIVQGIPKIEQLFEARESQGGEILSDTVHIRLRNAFVRELETLASNHWSIAVEKSFIEAQQFLVENIVDAYANQGVKISEKHVEVIVRQMTSRVRILESGETGLLPGELVQHTWIQKFNKHIRNIGLREATYEPIVLGISKSVLQSESFLLAASFQEVSRVLVRSALSKKRDFLRGLHENVIVGQLIPAGTGLLTQITKSELFSNTSYLK